MVLGPFYNKPEVINQKSEVFSHSSVIGQFIASDFWFMTYGLL